MDVKQAELYDLTPVWVSEESPTKKAKTLARLTIPLSALNKHLERLSEGFCMKLCVKPPLYDLDNEMLFLPLFWFLPLFRELLNTA